MFSNTWSITDRVLIIENDNDGHHIKVVTSGSSVGFYEDGLHQAWIGSHRMDKIVVNGNGGADTIEFVSVRVANSVIPPTIVNGGDGNDTILGNYGNDVINGDDGDDFLNDGNGHDYTNGGAGNDQLAFQYGNDTVSGGDGIDWMDLTLASRGCLITFDGLTNDYTSSNHLDNLLPDLETFIGSKFADKFHGSDADNEFFGNAGNDSLYGGGGNDSLHGGAGADQLYGEAGNDTFYGGEGGSVAIARDSVFGGDGDDFFFGFRDLGIDQIDGGDGFDTLSDYEALDILTSIEAIV
jgi:hypothetical protein